MTTFVIPRRTLPDAAQLILGLLAAGMTDGQIAAALDRAPGSVGTEIRRILTSLGAESRSQAVAMAYRQGWLDRVPAPRRGTPLAARQLEAVRLLVEGATASQTCIVMGLAPQGLRSLLRRACKRIGARGPAHLVRLAIDTGLVEHWPIGGQP